MAPNYLETSYAMSLLCWPCSCSVSVQPQVQDVEGKLPPKVPVVVKVPITPYQSAVYNWVKVGRRGFTVDTMCVCVCLCVCVFVCVCVCQGGS